MVVIPIVRWGYVHQLIARGHHIVVAEHQNALLRSSRIAWKNTRLEPANGPKSSKNRPGPAEKKAVLIPAAQVRSV